MDSEPPGYVGMSDFLSVSGRWVLNPVRLNRTFECIGLTTYMSTFKNFYVDDLCISSKDPKAITDMLT
jgi:hypothetical protein